MCQLEYNWILHTSGGFCAFPDNWKTAKLQQGHHHHPTGKPRRHVTSETCEYESEGSSDLISVIKPEGIEGP